MQPAVRQRVLVAAERLAEVAADLRQRPEVGHHVDLEPRIGGARAALERLVEEPLGLVQVALPPAHGGEDVERVAQRVAVVRLLGRRHGRVRRSPRPPA